MIRTVEINMPTKQVISKTCDRCGFVAYPDDQVEFNQFFHYKEHCGYFSSFGDGNLVEVDLCEPCVFELFKDFAVVKTDDIL